MMIILCLVGLARTAQGAIVPAKALVAQLLLERAFDRGLAMKRRQKPWQWADMAPVARLGVPRLGLTRIVLDGGSGQAMAFGPTMVRGTIGGDPGPIVLAAHRDTHFHFLKEVRRGDLIDLQGLDGVTRSYRVAGAEIVRWDRFATGSPSGVGELYLATCYPFDALHHGPLRYVVHAVPEAGPHERDLVANANPFVARKAVPVREADLPRASQGIEA